MYNPQNYAKCLTYPAAFLFVALACAGPVHADQKSDFDEVLEECIRFVTEQNGDALEYESQPFMAEKSGMSENVNQSGTIKLEFAHIGMDEDADFYQLWSCKAEPIRKWGWGFMDTYMAPDHRPFELAETESKEKFTRWRYIHCAAPKVPVEIIFRWYPRMFGDTWYLSVEYPPAYEKSACGWTSS